MAAQTDFDFNDLHLHTRKDDLFAVLATATSSDVASDGSRFGVYAASLGGDGVIFDCGRVKNPMTVYAHACSRIIGIIDQQSEPVNSLLIVTRRAGFEKCLKQYAKNWTDGDVKLSSRNLDVEAIDIWQGLYRRYRGGDGKARISFGTPQRDPGFVRHVSRLSSRCANALQHYAAAEPASWAARDRFLSGQRDPTNLYESLPA